MGQIVSDYFHATMEAMHERQMKEIMAKVKPEDFRVMETYEFEGVTLPQDCLRSTLEDLKTFHVRKSDVFIVTYPKTGTTWTQEIMSAVLHDGDIEKLNKKHTMSRVPFLELTHGGTVHEDVPRIHKMLVRLPLYVPRHIKSHLPGQLLPPQVWEKRVKIVYVVRDPKDVVVSFYHHLDMICPHINLQFDDLFDKFMEGKCPWGKWWDHYLYFWERRNEDHILFLRYEEMKKDPRGAVTQISEFLGKSLSDDVIDAITEHCSFQNMKNNPMTNPDTLMRLSVGPRMGDKTFMRKGEAGSWKARLSDSQSEALSALCREKLAGTGLSFE